MRDCAVYTTNSNAITLYINAYAVGVYIIYQFDLRFSNIFLLFAVSLYYPVFLGRNNRNGGWWWWCGDRQREEEKHDSCATFGNCFLFFHLIRVTVIAFYYYYYYNSVLSLSFTRLMHYNSVWQTHKHVPIQILMHIHSNHKKLILQMTDIVDCTRSLVYSYSFVQHKKKREKQEIFFLWNAL